MHQCRQAIDDVEAAHSSEVAARRSLRAWFDTHLLSLLLDAPNATTPPLYPWSSGVWEGLPASTWERPLAEWPPCPLKSEVDVLAALLQVRFADRIGTRAFVSHTAAAHHILSHATTGLDVGACVSAHAAITGGVAAMSPLFGGGCSGRAAAGAVFPSCRRWMFWPRCCRCGLPLKSEVDVLAALLQVRFPDRIGTRVWQTLPARLPNFTGAAVLQARAWDEPAILDGGIVGMHAVAREVRTLVLSAQEWWLACRIAGRSRAISYPSTAKVWQTLNIGKSPRVPNNLIFSGVVRQTLPVLR